MRKRSSYLAQLRLVWCQLRILWTASTKYTLRTPLRQERMVKAFPSKSHPNLYYNQIPPSKLDGSCSHTWVSQGDRTWNHIVHTLTISLMTDKERELAKELARMEGIARNYGA